MIVGPRQSLSLFVWTPYVVSLYRVSVTVSRSWNAGHAEAAANALPTYPGWNVYKSPRRLYSLLPYHTWTDATSHALG